MRALSRIFPSTRGPFVRRLSQQTPPAPPATLREALRFSTSTMASSPFREDGLTQPVATETIHPGWTPGQKQKNPAGHHRMVAIDPADPEIKSCYPLMISGIVPRPIALVSTVSSEGNVNLAPFSYFGGMSHDPPTVAFSICRKPGGQKKDTLSNLEAGKECVVHIMSEWYVEAANHTCGNFLPDEDEMEISGLTPVASTRVKPPRVEEAAFAMEAKVRHTYDISNAAGEVTATMVLVEVVLFHAHEDALIPSDGRPRLDFAKLLPISRLGGNTYARTSTHIFDLARPDRPAGGR